MGACRTKEFLRNQAYSMRINSHKKQNWRWPMTNLDKVRVAVGFINLQSFWQTLNLNVLICKVKYKATWEEDVWSGMDKHFARQWLTDPLNLLSKFQYPPLLHRLHSWIFLQASFSLLLLSPFSSMALSLHLSLSHKNFSNPFASFTPTTKLPTTIHINSHLLKSIHSKPYYIKKCHAVADAPTAIPPSLDAEDDAHGVLIGPSSEEERRGDGAVVDYNWTEEWYPLYLTKDVPDDAPLGLNVFDKQLVLYKDGQGELRCHEDRCPHRYLIAWALVSATNQFNAVVLVGSLTWVSRDITELLRFFFWSSLD